MTSNPTGEDVQCSDGGLGSHSYRISGRLFFICDFGGQVDKCGRRAITNTNLDGNDQSESSIESCGNLIDDGKCDDAGAKSFEDYAEEDDTVACTLGYGEDAVDCGARPIQFAAGEIAIKPPPSPPPPPLAPAAAAVATAPRARAAAVAAVATAAVAARAIAVAAAARRLPLHVLRRRPRQ